MVKKKMIMSVTLGAAIASTMIGADEAEAASYKVQSGDSLWKIAQKYNTSVQALIDINKLRSDIIYPNQMIKTDASSSNKNNQTQNKNANQSTSKTSKYTVKSGDTLSGIAYKHNISLQNLMKWNNLNTTLIYPGNVLVVKKSSSNTSSNNEQTSSNSNSNKEESSSSSTIYIVKSGDTLSHIGVQYSVSVANLKKWNNLSSDRIYVGQKLKIGAKQDSTSSTSDKNTSNKQPSNIDYNVTKLIDVATSLKGTKYAWGGTTPNGFDCSGYIYYVYKQAGKKDIKRLSSAGYYDRSYYVNNPKVGDLVFFEGTYKSGISHMGIYLGNNQFIHAGSDGVEVVSLNNSYWKKHFSSFKRFY